ncbi:PAS domain-containing protein [Mucilaginibacter lacusdianchii]|uniref:PAS domain-containing protein n=1 Tax=Mucilaginibacter lacusdianchii TaxID=2684211 RepID=UPI00131B87C1|nr:PAS domain-containing protein [Mucilaginibacter sp. JXJ CY 39]
MHHLQDPLFQILFNQLKEPRLLVKAASPHYTVIAGNQAWQELFRKRVNELSGANFLAMVEEIAPNDALTEQINENLQRAVLTSSSQTLEPFLIAPDGLIWWQMEFLPIGGEGDGEAKYVMCSLNNVTAQVAGQIALETAQQNELHLLREQQALNEELAAANEEFSAINEELLQSQASLSELNQELEARVEQRTQALAESESRIRGMVEQSAAAMLVLHGDNLVIDIANPQMLELLGKSDHIIGLPLLDALPEIKGQPIFEILHQVYQSGEQVSETEIQVELYRNGQTETGYFNFTYTPLWEENRITGVLEVATEVTEMVKARNKIEESARRFTRMVLTTPIGMCVIKGRNLIIDIANQPILDVWGRISEDVLGKKLIDVFPELEGQPYPKMLLSIFDKKEPVAFAELPVTIILPEGGVKQAFIDFSYDPLFDDDGNVEAILVSVKDITEMVESRKLLQERQEEMEALNEELAASNEELMTTNEELTEAQMALERMVDQLADSEQRLSSLIDQAPVGMCFLRGENLVIDLVNQAMLDIWGRTQEEVLGKLHKQARPELQGQSVHAWMDEAYQTGITRYNTDLKVTLYHQGGLREAYVNSIYHPLKDQNGKVTGLLIILNETTDRILAQKKAERVQEQLSMAVESAQLGTWYLNTETQEFFASPRLKELFGFLPDEEMTFAAAAAQITDDYRDMVLNTIEKVALQGGSYDLEYPVHDFHDGKLRWIKATGKLYPAENGQPAHFSGTKMDITQRKLEEIRKNDFIAIASHELKTPLTSLKAYLQVMNIKAQKAEESFYSSALTKSLTQIDKMQVLIKGFLDVARAESGKLHLDATPFDLNELLQESADEATLLYPSHQISVLPCNQVKVMADRDKIGQVLSNFLSNAIKYSPKGKMIELFCSHAGNDVKIQVKDEGMGIKPQDLDRLFDRFYRVESKHTKTISGFGIGLYLCAEIIRLHNGKIWAESTPGVGSSFYFTLPIYEVG